MGSCYCYQPPPGVQQYYHGMEYVGSDFDPYDEYDMMHTDGRVMDAVRFGWNKVTGKKNYKQDERIEDHIEDLKEKYDHEKKLAPPKSSKGYKDHVSRLTKLSEMIKHAEKELGRRNAREAKNNYYDKARGSHAQRMEYNHNLPAPARKGADDEDEDEIPTVPTHKSGNLHSGIHHNSHHTPSPHRYPSTDPSEYYSKGHNTGSVPGVPSAPTSHHSSAAPVTSPHPSSVRSQGYEKAKSAWNVARRGAMMHSASQKHNATYPPHQVQI